MNDSEIVHGKNGEAVSFNGPDAVHLYRAASLVSFLKLYAKTGIIPTRGVTGPKMLKIAADSTGKKYKRGAYLEAAEDVRIWCETMKAALPTRTA